MIIEMALDFATMTRVFSEGSKPKILQKLEQLFAGLDCIREGKTYDRLHANFCVWFTKNIDVAERKVKEVIKPAHRTVRLLLCSALARRRTSAYRRCMEHSTTRW
jgi:hypothetical protein